MQAPRAPLIVAGIALTLLAIAAVLLLFSRSPKLESLGMILVAAAWIPFLVLGLRAARAGRMTRNRRPYPAEQGEFALADNPTQFNVDRIEQEMAERRVVEQRAEHERAAQERAERERADREALARVATFERVRRLTESNFLAGSNALLDVRSLLRGVQDCRHRLDDAAPGQSSSRESAGDPADTTISEALDALLVDLEQLAVRVRAIPALAHAGVARNGRESSNWSVASRELGIAGNGGPANGNPPGESDSSRGSNVDRGRGQTESEEIVRRLATLDGISSPRPSPIHAAGTDRRQLLVALKLRALAAELDHRLLGLRASVRGLKRARLMRSSLRGQASQRRRSAEAWPRALDRLEAQANELAEKVARFTRDSEQLSRELDQLK